MEFSDGLVVGRGMGEKALVISKNEDNFLRPTVLSFSDNSIRKCIYRMAVC